MEIIIAKNSGLCYGVKRALQMARKARLRAAGPVYTLGELIHNPQIIADLENQGLHAVDDPAFVDKGTIIIRSHGVAPETYKILKGKNVEIIDATCPIVQRIQELVEGVAQKNDEIVIVGNTDHPEIQGLIGYSSDKARIIESEPQARSLPRKKTRAVLAQSTLDVSLFGRVVAVLAEKTEKLTVYNTICRSTETRQKSTSELAYRVDVLFIIGGKNSSNTNTLYRISKRILPRTYLIESAREITPRLLKRAKRIGISGGASTPPEAIAEAVAKIRKSFQYQSQRENLIQWQS